MTMLVESKPIAEMGAPGNFAERDIATVARALRDGSTTAGELVRRVFADVERLNPVLNCFVGVDRDGAREAAVTLDRELMNGTDRGPLHGIPVAIKDIIDVAGQITTSGSALFRDRVAASDSACVARLRAAGAIVVGKTVLHEFAYGITGDRSFHGASRNPHDPARMSGGSSGGSAVAVAAGIVPLALGTDTAGSVRVPASLCGVVGYKPSYDAIPRDGVHPLAESLDHVGLFTRNVADARSACEVLVDGALASGEISQTPRLGWVAPSAFGPVEPMIDRGLLALLDRAGLSPTPVTLREGAGLFEVLTAIQSPEAYLAHVDDVRDGMGRIDDEVAGRLQNGARLPAWQYLDALRKREALRLDVDALFGSFDLLAMPTTPTVAPKIGDRSLRIDGVAVEARSALLSLTSPWNLLGLPALSVPAGLMAGLPFGLQLICPAGREGGMFELASRIERARIDQS
ncbi:MAG TPA: amidase [Aestuariivirgaceae bacterium]|nr:amidase [Aestuariivirgaceae bacterium]